MIELNGSVFIKGGRQGLNTEQSLNVFNLVKLCVADACSQVVIHNLYYFFYGENIELINVSHMWRGDVCISVYLKLMEHE
jgi:hypothetical protein